MEYLGEDFMRYSHIFFTTLLAVMIDEIAHYSSSLNILHASSMTFEECCTGNQLSRSHSPVMMPNTVTDMD